MTRLALFALSALLCCSTASAQIHKWVDADGKVHYSDQPPPAQVKGEKLKVQSGVSGSNGDAQTGKSMAEQEMEFRKRRTENAEAATARQQEEAAATESAQNCVQARQQLASLQSGARLSRFNEAGERIYMDDQERQAEIERAQKAADSWCK